MSKKILENSRKLNKFSLRSAVYWTKELLSNKMKEGWTIPTPEKFVESYEKGKQQGMDNWYEDFNKMVSNYCFHREDELQFFMSLIATASPNSGVNQVCLR